MPSKLYPLRQKQDATNSVPVGTLSKIRHIAPCQFADIKKVKMPFCQKSCWGLQEKEESWSLGPFLLFSRLRENTEKVGNRIGTANCWGALIRRSRTVLRSTKWPRNRTEVSLYSYTTYKYYLKLLSKKLKRWNQCCGSGSGIRYLFYPSVRDPGWVKNQDPDPWWIFWKHFLGLKYSNSLMRIRIRDPKIFLSFDPESGVRDKKNSDPKSGINIPDPHRWMEFLIFPFFGPFSAIFFLIQSWYTKRKNILHVEANWIFYII